MLAQDAEFWRDLAGPPPMVAADPLKEARAAATASTRPTEAAASSLEADEDERPLPNTWTPQLHGLTPARARV